MSSSSSMSALSMPATPSLEQQLAAVNLEIQEVKQQIQKLDEELKITTDKDDKLYLRKKEEQLRKEKEQLRKKEEQLREKELVLMKQQQLLPAVERKTVAGHGLPALGRGGVGAGSPSSASENKKHLPAKLLVKPFTVLKNLKLHDEGASIWETAKNEQLFWHSESGIQGFVRQVLGDVIAAAGLIKEIDLANELSVVDQRPDIWLVLKNGVPVGVVEVKKPGHDIMQKPSVFGQIYDYLLQLQSFHGLKTPFGIVTTYKQWRICWLDNDNSDSLAVSDSIQDSSAAEAKVPEIEETLDDGERSADIDLGEPAKMSNDHRIVHGTNIMQFDDDSLVTMLASLLHKMTHVELSPVKLLDESRSYIVANEKSWYWARLSLPKADTRLSSTAMPNLNTQQFWLLKDFRGGVDGRVWLACSRGGLACVIKFSVGDGSDDDKKDRLETEMKRWQSINHEERVRVQRIAGSWALLMPYLRHATEADFANDQFRADTIEEVNRWGKAGYQQDDAGRRHVGVMSPGVKGSKARPVFFDLAHVQSDVAEGDAVAHMLKKLNLN
jgi:hypothetical protein